MLDELTPSLIRSAVVDGNPRIQNTLVKLLSPVITISVRTSLGKYARQRGRDPQVFADDYVQGTWLHLWDVGCEKLLKWDPDLGSPSAYFGTITRHFVIDRLTSRPKSHLTDEPTDGAEFDALLEDHQAALLSMLDELERRDLLVKLYDCLVDQGTDREVMLFDLVYRDGLSHAEAAAILHLTLDALYQAHHRLVKRLKEIAQQLLRDP